MAVAVAHVEGEVTIRRPVEEVFDFVADERNEPRFNRRMRRAELVSEGPIGLGTCFVAEMSKKGRPFEMLIEFTDYDRPRRIGSVTHMSWMDTSGAVSFDTVPEGTRMCWSWDLQPKGVLKLLTPILAEIGRRQ
jgi:hypothetical protein